MFPKKGKKRGGKKKKKPPPIFFFFRLLGPGPYFGKKGNFGGARFSNLLCCMYPPKLGAKQKTVGEVFPRANRKKKPGGGTVWGTPLAGQKTKKKIGGTPRQKQKAPPTKKIKKKLNGGNKNKKKNIFPWEKRGKRGNTGGKTKRGIGEEKQLELAPGGVPKPKPGGERPPGGGGGGGGWAPPPPPPRGGGQKKLGLGEGGSGFRAIKTSKKGGGEGGGGGGGGGKKGAGGGEEKKSKGIKKNFLEKGRGGGGGGGEKGKKKIKGKNEGGGGGGKKKRGKKNFFPKTGEKCLGLFPFFFSGAPPPGGLSLLLGNLVFSLPDWWIFITLHLHFLCFLAGGPPPGKTTWARTQTTQKNGGGKWGGPRLPGRGGNS